MPPQIPSTCTCTLIFVFILVVGLTMTFFSSSFINMQQVPTGHWQPKHHHNFTLALLRQHGAVSGTPHSHTGNSPVTSHHSHTGNSPVTSHHSHTGNSPVTSHHSHTGNSPVTSHHSHNGNSPVTSHHSHTGNSPVTSHHSHTGNSPVTSHHSHTGNSPVTSHHSHTGNSPVTSHHSHTGNSPVTSQHRVSRRPPDISVDGANCTLLTLGGEAAMAAARKVQKQKIKSGFYSDVEISPVGYLRLTKSCATFRASRGYINESMTSEERDFPLAYSILMYKDVYQFERLLRAIYRPQNYYCTHVDNKASDEIKSAVRAIVGCLDNAFVLSQLYNVRWGTMSVLSLELDCMRELTLRPGWRYFINLTGQEWPLQTNWQLVRALTALGGGSIVGGKPGRITAKRAANRWKQGGQLPFPVNLTKGAAHVVVPREFVRYVATDVRAQQLKAWVAPTRIPDETYFPTLYFSPRLGVPGAYNGPLSAWPLDDQKKFPARYKIWQHDRLPCRGYFQRNICIFGLGDLPALTSTHHMFANKLELKYQPMTLDCLEELYFRRVRDEISGTRVFNESVYTRYAYFKYHT